MPHFFLVRVLLVLLSVVALGCSGQDSAPAPPRITGTWEMTKQVITTFNPDGTVVSSTSYDTYVADAQLWHYVFNANGSFDYTYQGQTQRKGTYATTATTLVQTNAPGFGSQPTFTFTIQELSATELVLVTTSRATTGRESITTWTKH